MQAVCRIVSLQYPVPYGQAFEWQCALHAQRRAGSIDDTLLLLEHAPVVTIGRGAPGSCDLLTSREALHKRGIDTVETDRGGRITYHAPGQLVGYPILDLGQQPEERDLHRYLRNLEEALIATLAEFGIAGERKDGLTGVWVGDRKIAAIGVKVSRWVTMHGFALNIDTDLGVFREDIVPCGIRDKDVTSLAECGVAVDRAQVEAVLAPALCRALNRHSLFLLPSEIGLPG